MCLEEFAQLLIKSTEYQIMILLNISHDCSKMLLLDIIEHDRNSHLKIGSWMKHKLHDILEASNKVLQISFSIIEDNPAYSPTRDLILLGATRDLYNRDLTSQRSQRNEFVAFKSKVIICFICNKGDFMLISNSNNFEKMLFAVDSASGTRRIGYHDEFSLIINFRFEVFEVDFPVIVGKKLVGLGYKVITRSRINPMAIAGGRDEEVFILIAECSHNVVDGHVITLEQNNIIICKFTIGEGVGAGDSLTRDRHATGVGITR
mmetsp:Transcript_15133/g.12864  ORF Transcript_15133/g.12864 Transcript_15133/m.12864 type:complete len:262 (-) Transcript_15133:276-1061(-)